MAIPATYSMSRMQRSPPSLPFGWGAVTVLLVGALFTIIGIVIIIYAAFGFITGTIGAALGGGGVLGIFSSMMGAIILYAFFGFITGTVGAALGGGGVLSILSTFMGAIILFVIGGVLAGIGGWLIRLWWIFLLVGVVAGTAGNTARDREAARTSEVRVRCQSCGRLNPEFVKFCMSCGKPV